MVSLCWFVSVKALRLLEGRRCTVLKTWSDVWVILWTFSGRNQGPENVSDSPKLLEHSMTWSSPSPAPCCSRVGSFHLQCSAHNRNSAHWPSRFQWSPEPWSISWSRRALLLAHLTAWPLRSHIPGHTFSWENYLCQASSFPIHIMCVYIISHNRWVRKSAPWCTKNRPTLANDKTVLIIHWDKSEGPQKAITK